MKKFKKAWKKPDITDKPQQWHFRDKTLDEMMHWFILPELTYFYKAFRSKMKNCKRIKKADKNFIATYDNVGIELVKKFFTKYPKEFVKKGIPYDKAAYEAALVKYKEEQIKNN